MKKLFLLLLAAVLLLTACNRETPEITDEVQTTTGETTAATTEYVYPSDFTVSPSEVTKVDKLPLVSDVALVSGSVVGGWARGYAFDLGLVYYIEYVNTLSEDDSDYYRGKLTLPDGYTNGCITAINGGAGSGEMFFTVLAEKDGEEVALEYMFFVEDGFEKPITVRALDEIPETPFDELFEVVDNSGNLDISTLEIPLRTEKTRVNSWDFDEQYKIYLTYEILKNDASGLESCTYDIFIVDKYYGEIVYEEALNVNGYPKMIHYYSNSSCNIYDITVDGNETSTSAEYRISEKGGSFAVSSYATEKFPYEVTAYPCNTKKVVSPSGKYTALQKMTDGWNNGGIYIKYAKSPEEKQILKNVMLGDTPECKAKGIGDVIGYSIIGFIDETHLAYSIGGWEWLIGYGIYDIENNTKQEFKGKTPDRAVAAYGGYLYTFENVYNDEGYTTPVGIYRVTANGKKEKIKDDGSCSFVNSKWCKTEATPVDTWGRARFKNVKIYSADFEEVLAEIKYFDANSSASSDLLIYENKITVVMPKIAQ